MESSDERLKRDGRRSRKALIAVAALAAAVVVAGASYRYQHTFSTSKWRENPEERTKIVDDLLDRHELRSMSEAEITALLGSDNSDYGYFNDDNRFVYHLGMERGLISIDSEWLILDFDGGTVSDCYITTD